MMPGRRAPAAQSHPEVLARHGRPVRTAHTRPAGGQLLWAQECVQLVEGAGGRLHQARAARTRTPQ